MAKNFSWSFSKLAGYETCPKRFYEVSVAKHFVDSTDNLDWGNEVHKALQEACESNAPLPLTMVNYQKWVDAVRKAPGKLYVEQKLAITKEFTPCGWSDWDRAWFRGICDLMKISGDTCTAVDWKTGKVKHESVQLMLMAQCIFAHHPEVNTVKTRFVWLKEDCTTPEVFFRDTIMDEWPGVLARVAALEIANRKLDFPPRPGGLCRKYCPVTSCPFYGKGR